MRDLELYHPVTVKKIDYVQIQRREYERLKKVENDLFRIKESLRFTGYSLAILLFGFVIGTGIIGLVK